MHNFINTHQHCGGGVLGWRVTSKEPQGGMTDGAQVNGAWMPRRGT